MWSLVCLSPTAPWSGSAISLDPFQVLRCTNKPSREGSHGYTEDRIFRLHSGGQKLGAYVYKKAAGRADGTDVAPPCTAIFNLWWFKQQYAVFIEILFQNILLTRCRNSAITNKHNILTLLLTLLKLHLLVKVRLYLLWYAASYVKLPRRLFFFLAMCTIYPLQGGL